MQAADVPFATVDARMRREVGSDPDAELFPVAEVATGDVGDVIGAVLEVPLAAALTTSGLQPVRGGGSHVELGQRPHLLAGVTPLLVVHGGLKHPPWTQLLTKTGGPRGARTHDKDGLKVRCSTN